MRHILFIIFLLLYALFCFADDQIQPPKSTMNYVNFPAKYIRPPQLERTIYNFAFPPTTIMPLSFWDYQIGGLRNYPVRMQSQEAGNGVYLTYMGQPASQRYVYYAYINHDGSVLVNDRATNSTLREGYSSLDIDRDSGRPLFAWHTANDIYNSDIDVYLSYDFFLDGAPTMLSQPSLVINNPIDMPMVTHDNPSQCLWPVVHIGTSPIPNHRRLYIFTTVSADYSLNGFPGGNIYYAYADFTSGQLESDTTFEWSYASIPLLNSWDDWMHENEMRFFYHTIAVGEDGKVYVIGYHIPNIIGLVEPHLDVFVNSDYGAGEWTYYSMDPDIEVTVPEQEAFPYATLKYSESYGSHNTAFITPDGHLHYPLIFSLNTPDNQTTFPLTQYIKDVDFNVTDHSFLIHDLYPTGVYPNDGNPVLPWDINEDGITDSTITVCWPYDYYDETAEDGNMEYNHNAVRFTKMNEQGMVAAVWSSSLKSKLYIEHPDSFPQFAPYAMQPEIFISVYPVPGVDGPQWSEPISLNAVTTPGMAGMTPTCAYPGDYIEYLGVTAEGYKVGKLHLMFYDDNMWGVQCTNGNLTNLGGSVQYAALNIAWCAGIPQVGDIVVSTNDQAVSPLRMKLSNYPNPFNPSTTIAYDIEKAGKTTVTIYNVKGQFVKHLVNESMPIGHHTVKWNGDSEDSTITGSGVYFYKLENSGKTITNKMVLMK